MVEMSRESTKEPSTPSTLTKTGISGQEAETMKSSALTAPESSSKETSEPSTPWEAISWSALAMAPSPSAAKMEATRER